jgi:hypothetical protein
MKLYLKSLSQISCCAVAITVMSSPTFAVTMRAVYTGKVFNSYDGTNEFGRGTGSSLDGLSFILTYVYDPSHPGSARYKDAAQDQSNGGNLFRYPSPILSASIKIADVTHIIEYNYQDYIANSTDGATYSSAQHFVSHYESDNTKFNYNRAYGMSKDHGLAIPIDLEANFASTGAAMSGYFEFYGYDYVQSKFLHNAYGSLAPDKLIVTRADKLSPVPLPPALPMLATALAGLGVATRRRKNQVMAGSASG